jgi:hypothetical protein
MPFRATTIETKRYQKTDFYHIYTNETLKLDLWRDKQPNNGATDEMCIMSYLGNYTF